MMAQRKRARPAMYELMKGQRMYGQSSHAPVEHPNHELDHEPVPTVSWLDRLRAGHSMRIPVGYMFLTIPALLLIVVVAYIFGFSRGETTSTTLDEARGATPEFAINDPLGRPLLNEPGNPVTPTNNTRAPTSGNNSGSAPSRSGAAFNMQNLGPIHSDPRQVNVTYFVLAETNPTGAERLASFCRANGLAGFVVASRSDRFRKVIVLPGFDIAARSTEPVKQLEELIREVGRKWKAAEPGATDLSDAYPQTHKG